MTAGTAITATAWNDLLALGCMYQNELEAACAAVNFRKGLRECLEVSWEATYESKGKLEQSLQ